MQEKTDNTAKDWKPPVEKPPEKERFTGKGTRARLNTAAEKHFFNSKYST